MRNFYVKRKCPHTDCASWLHPDGMFGRQDGAIRLTFEEAMILKRAASREYGYAHYGKTIPLYQFEITTRPQ